MDRNDLEYFKQKLMAKKRELANSVQKSETYGREAESEEESKDLVDRASSSYTKEFMFNRSNSDRQFLMQVNAALQRIDNEEYGICSNCEEEVERKRLEAVPWAILCLKCQEKNERRRR